MGVRWQLLESHIPKCKKTTTTTCYTEKIITHSVLGLSFLIYKAECFPYQSSAELRNMQGWGTHKLEKHIHKSLWICLYCRVSVMLLRTSGHSTESAHPSPNSCVKSVALHCVKFEAWKLKGSAKNNYEKHQGMQKTASKMDKFSASVNQHRLTGGSYTREDSFTRMLCCRMKSSLSLQHSLEWLNPKWSCTSTGPECFALQMKYLTVIQHTCNRELLHLKQFIHIWWGKK